MVPSISRALNHPHTQEIKADSAKCLMNQLCAPEATIITGAASRTVSAEEAPCSLVVSNKGTADVPHYEVFDRPSAGGARPHDTIHASSCVVASTSVM